MCNQVKVSVIMPSLNVAPYIRECIESVINQTLKEIEIICVDAGSTDGTLEILREYAEKDPRITVILSDKKSYGYQMNLGIKAAKGEYMGIVETDDYVLPEMYETLYKEAEDNQVDFVRSNIATFAGDGNDRQFNYIPLTYWKSEYKKYYNTVLDPKKNLLLFNMLKNNVTGIYRMDFLRKNHILLNETPGAAFQDNGFWFLTYVYANAVYYINESFYMCRRDREESSVRQKDKAFVICEEYDYILNRLRADKELYETFIGAYWVGKFVSYNFNYKRIAAEYKSQFAQRFVDEFSAAMQRGELIKELFPPENWEKLNSLLNGRKANSKHNLLFGAIQCCKDHGFWYTCCYAVKKLRGKDQ